MVRIEIQLTEQQAKAVKAIARAHGISTAEVIRRAIDVLLESTILVNETEKRARALTVVGRFRSGKQDISEKHDAYFVAGESAKRLSKLGGSEKHLKSIKRRWTVDD
jgi:transposase-like protein